MKRVYVYRNKSEQNGKVLAVENTIEALKSDISKLFEQSQENLRLYSSNGCEIEDVRVLRDDDKIYLCVDGNGESKSCDSLANKMENLSMGDGQPSKPGKTVSDWITLNVGGKHFTTSRSTLLAKEPLSMLARMFADDNNVYLMTPSATDSVGAYLIDRSPEYFEPILNYLRHGDVILDKHVNPKGVMEEAVFYGAYLFILFSTQQFVFYSFIMFRLPNILGLHL